MSKMGPHDLKQLQVRKDKLSAERDALKKEFQDVQSKIETVNSKIKEVNVLINNINKNPIVSEHAILRYAERVLGVDIDEIKDSLLSENNIKTINTLGSGKYPLGDGNFAVVKGKTIVSIVSKD